MKAKPTRIFKVGALYRNAMYPEALYMCIGKVRYETSEKTVFHYKQLVIINDKVSGREGHVVADFAMKNWKWHKV